MKKTFVAAALLTAFPAFAVQPDAGWLLGFGAGQSQVREAESPPFDDRSTAGKVFLGYQLNRVLAIEGGYVYLGRFDPAGAIGAGGSSRVYGAFVEALGMIPLSARFSLFGKVGAIRAKVKASAGTSPSESAPIVGFGANWNLDRDFTLRIEGERFRELGDKDVAGGSDVDLVSASLIWKY